jgi:rhodanese-related sulfurtransferase
MTSDPHRGDGDPATELPAGYPFRPGEEMTPAEAARRLAAGGFTLLDVREDDELRVASIPGAVQIRLGELEKRWDELDAGPEETFGVLCHHGRRSLRATLFLHAIGLRGARSVAGGIEQWSLRVDPGVPRY